MRSKISDSIKRRRGELGLSLSELAKLIDTSPATLSRYERGWNRFEVYTLEKIAQALGCCLRVEMEPLAVGRPSVGRAESIARLGRLFWDRDLKKGDLSRYPRWVVQRVLEYGSLDDIHLLIRLMGRAFFLKTVSNCRFQSKKTAVFWDAILEKRGVGCTKRAFRRDAWLS